MTRKTLQRNKFNGLLLLIILVITSLLTAPMYAQLSERVITNDTIVKASFPLVVTHSVKGALTKRVQIDVSNPLSYANISVYANDKLLIDNLNIPKTGRQQLNSLLKFEETGNVTLTLRSNHADLTVHSLIFDDVEALTLPSYQDTSVKAGIDKVSSIKYGGPTIADLDNDGDYDFIVNNHNAESSKIYWNNGDGSVSKHHKNLSRWRLQDLHGTAAGDYDNDGDLDLVLSLGGGNGKNPSKVNFYQNNDGEFLLTTGDVGIDKGARGRGANWSDMDLDGDLDLMLINETSLYYKDKPQHLFYENLGDGTFSYRQIENLEMDRAHRSIVTDINNDNIDDIVLYGPLSLWLGNGDFTFTEATSQFPEPLQNLKHIMAVTDIDIDNDGDMDLYIARGKEFEHGYGEAPWIETDPVKKEFSIRSRGYSGGEEFEFTAHGPIKFYKYYYLAQGVFRGQDYPIFLGSQKTPQVLASGEELNFTQEQAQGWPSDISENGVYFGHLGNGRWKAALVRNGNVFWGFKFSLLGVSELTYDFTPQNRNESDILLRNDGTKFTDVSTQWKIPKGANSLGVTTGDFNNDTHQDLFVYRWGLVSQRISDYMLLNNGNGSFETITMHGANDVGGPGHGDMGQSFDFDLDGSLDILSGSENGEWYLYTNHTPDIANYALVRVGYSPKSNIDAIGAKVIIKTPKNEYQKRVGSAGGIFSQSLLNIVHFGLGSEDSIEQIKVRWRNGEETLIVDKKANQLFATDKLDPCSLTFAQANTQIRAGTSKAFKPEVLPRNADSSITWSSSDPNVLSVNTNGVVTALGGIGQTATITATSLANGMQASLKVKIVKWFAQTVNEIALHTDSKEMIAGQNFALKAQVQPKEADDTDILWGSSNTAIASVDSMGMVIAKQAGTAIIRATAKSNRKENATTKITVIPYVAPYLSLIDENKYRNSKFAVGENISINVDYHAGSGNKIISSDQGGMRFWLRHFKINGGIAGKDYIVTNTDVLGTRSGRASTNMFIHDNIIPSDELPEGHYYMLRVSFTNSQGEVLDKIISPITILKNNN